MNTPSSSSSSIPGAVRTVVDQFSRMVKSDGGVISILGMDGAVVRVGYRPGSDPNCEDGSCILPQVELQELMAEALQLRDPKLKVAVELVK